MLSNLLTVTGQVATLFLMMAVGFVLGRAGFLTGGAGIQLGDVVLCLVWPCVMADVFLFHPYMRYVRSQQKGSPSPDSLFFIR